MKAFILAAGLGTRLKPLTNNKPKALVEVNGVTLLEHLIVKLQNLEVTELIINVHHYAEQIKEFLRKKNNFGIRIEVSDETEQLLDTGGGLKKAAWFFDDNKPFLVHNVDVLSNIDLNQLYQTHLQSGSLATLAVKDRNTSRYFLFNDNNELCGWENTKTGEILYHSNNSQQLTALAFSGIQVISPHIFDKISETGKFSLTDLYIRLSSKNKITAFRHDRDFWLDLGKPESIDKAENYLIQNKVR
ncbi:MAG: nucleotidyltransferase family protein [Bacteroidales bacterium]|jgi:NDP-sugar pyrophosphorylase family protein